MSSPNWSASPPAQMDETNLVAALREGDEKAFASLIDQYHASLIRLAMLYVSDRAVAEEVAQETWLGVVQGLDKFEGRSSLKTWIFAILTNQAKTRGQREKRSLPFSTLQNLEGEVSEPAVEPHRFRSADDQWAGGWLSHPDGWKNVPEELFAAQETHAAIQQAIETLLPAQRAVITLRDINGWTAQEVCNTLGVSETNQRVLLHRARSKVRRALERYLEGQ